jgi:hypothetical protein
MRSSFRRFRKIALLFAALASALAVAPACADAWESFPASTASAQVASAATEAAAPAIESRVPCARTPAAFLRISPATSARYLVHCALLL